MEKAAQKKFGRPFPFLDPCVAAFRLAAYARCVRAFLLEPGVTPQMTEQVADEVSSQKATTVLSYLAAAVNIMFGMTISEWCMLIGAACALGTFLVNWWYKHKEHVRAEKVASAKVRGAGRRAYQ